MDVNVTNNITLNQFYKNRLICSKFIRRADTLRHKREKYLKPNFFSPYEIRKMTWRSVTTVRTLMNEEVKRRMNKTREKNTEKVWEGNKEDEEKMGGNKGEVNNRRMWRR
jgi:hypothetical protein